MNCNNIIATPEFSKALKRLAKHYKSIKNDFSQLLEQLKENPTMGIDLGRGLRKIRMTITSKGKSKSGGARVITLVTIHEINSAEVMLLAIYDKSERENISDKELSDLLKHNGL